jgi:transposase
VTGQRGSGKTQESGKMPASLEAPFRKTDAAAEPPPSVPKTRQITRLLQTRPAHLQPGEQAQLAGIRAQCPHLDSLAGHITAFAEMMADLTGSTGLDAWLAAVEADDQPELRSFATGIRNDKEAVMNGLTLPHNSGRVGGTVNKIILWNQICQVSGATPTGL